RPDGKLPGLTMAAGYALAGKRVDLLKDMVGSLSRVAVLANLGNPPHVPYLRETERATSALGLAMQAFEVRGPNELPGVFAAMADWHADGLVTLTDGMLFSNRDRVAALALASKLPAVYPEAEFVAAGGLSSYGPHLPDLFRAARGHAAAALPNVSGAPEPR